MVWVWYLNWKFYVFQHSIWMYRDISRDYFPSIYIPVPYRTGVSLLRIWTRLNKIIIKKTFLLLCLQHVDTRWHNSILRKHCSNKPWDNSLLGCLQRIFQSLPYNNMTENWNDIHPQSTGNFQCFFRSCGNSNHLSLPNGPQERSTCLALDCIIPNCPQSL